MVWKKSDSCQFIQRKFVRHEFRQRGGMAWNLGGAMEWPEFKQYTLITNIYANESTNFGSITLVAPIRVPRIVLVLIV